MVVLLGPVICFSPCAASLLFVVCVVREAHSHSCKHFPQLIIRFSLVESWPDVHLSCHRHPWLQISAALKSVWICPLPKYGSNDTAQGPAEYIPGRDCIVSCLASTVTSIHPRLCPIQPFALATPSVLVSDICSCVRPVVAADLYSLCLLFAQPNRT